MIKKIAFALIFVCLLIAIPLGIAGYERVELGAGGLALLQTTARDLENFKIEIPNIPQIPLFESPKGIELVLNFLSKVVNGLSYVINFVILVLNYVIQLIEYAVILIKNLITFKNNVQPYVPQE